MVCLPGVLPWGASFLGALVRPCTEVPFPWGTSYPPVPLLASSPPGVARVQGASSCVGVHHHSPATVICCLCFCFPAFVSHVPLHLLPVFPPCHRFLFLCLICLTVSWELYLWLLCGLAYNEWIDPALCTVSCGRCDI
uniref:Uncharacterized protein n=1 Tax=Cacopsylla melanoneura TaxID=428564 RepID=A0A8D8RNW1_9HEMI